MEILGFAITGWLLLNFGLGFLVLLAVTVIEIHTREREGEYESYGRWAVAVAGLIILAVCFWSSWSFSDVTNSNYWKPVLAYLTIGLIYSVVEFIWAVIKAKRYWKIEWQKQLTKDYSSHAWVTDVKDFESGHISEEALRSKTFIKDYGRKTRYFIGVKEEKNAVQPDIRVGVLSLYLADWIVLWPFFAVNLIFGNLLIEVWNFLARALKFLTGSLVKLSFGNIFKL